MALEKCSNTCGKANTGANACDYKEGYPAGFILMKITADDGTLNSIPADSTFEQADLDALINHADESKRMYPLMAPFGERLDVIVPTVSDPETITTDFGKIIRVTDNSITSWSFKIYYTNASYVAKINKAIKCGVWGVYRVDANGKIEGQESVDMETLYPLEIESFYAKFIPCFKGNPATAEVSFSYSLAANPIYRKWHIDVTANVLAANGLKNMFAKLIGTPTSTTVTLDVFIDSGVAGGSKAEGLVAADFDILKVSDDSAVTITGVVEIASGRYTITCSSSTGLLSYPVITKTGYDASDVSTVTFTFA